MVNHLLRLGLIIIFAFGLSLTTGCELEETPTTTEPIPTELTPMGLNRLMVYHTEQKLNGDPTYDNIDSFRTAQEKLVWLGCEWFNDVGNDSVFWRNGIDGVWRLRLGAIYPNGLAEKMYAFPARAGEKWSVPSDNDSISLVSNNETVSVSAGSFDGCYRYRVARADRSRVQTVWFKPGVGRVQDSWVQYVAGDTLTSNMQLKAVE